MRNFFGKLAFFTVTRLLKIQAIRLLRRHPEVKLVAVTGSVGKTTAKLAIAEVLKTKYRVLVHPGNYNSETGVPLSLFEMESPGSVLKIGKWLRILWNMELKLKESFPYEVIVQEIGASKANDIAYFKFLKPDIGVVVAAKPAHVEGFGSIETITEEKFKLAKFSRFALVNKDEQRLADKLGELPRSKYKTFGLESADYWYDIKAYDLDKGFDGVMHLPGKDLNVSIKLPARHSLYAAVAAAAVGDLMDLSDEQMVKGLQGVRPVNGRMNLLLGINGSKVIDDTYNANPEAVIPAVQALYSAQGHRKIAILGGMNELGPDSLDYHRQVGSHLGELDLLVTVAEFAKQYIPAAIEAGLSEDKIVSFDSPYEAGEYVAKLVKPGDVVLVKGSQGGIFSEEATAKLLVDPKDKSKLVRQSDFWHGVKKRTFERAKVTYED